MTAVVSDKRTRLVEAAVELAHQKGFHRMTLAMIAESADVPLGNVYYYFKTKEDIGMAIIEALLTSLRGILAECERQKKPREQLVTLVRKLMSMREGLSRHGCPFSALAIELNKDDGDFARRSSTPLETLLAWCEERFAALGHSSADSHKYALHMVAAIQGACLMSNAFHDDRVFEREGRTVITWLRDL